MKKIGITGVALCLLLAGCSQIDTAINTFNHVTGQLSETSVPPAEPNVQEERTSYSIAGDKINLTEDATLVYYDLSEDEDLVHLTFEVALEKLHIREVYSFSSGEITDVVSEVIPVAQELQYDGSGDAPDPEIDSNGDIVYPETEKVPVDVVKRFAYVFSNDVTEDQFRTDGSVYIYDEPKSLLFNSNVCATLQSLQEYIYEILDVDEDTFSSFYDEVVINSYSKRTFDVAAYRLTVRTGETEKIVIDSLPIGFTAEDVSLKSDSAGHASVDKYGTVTGKRNGSATITVSLKGGGGTYRSVYIQVY